MPVRFETRCIRLTILGKGKIKVTSDGFFPEGILSCEELNRWLASLTGDGWNLVSSVDRTSPRVRFEAMDLFFRKELPRLTGESTPRPEIECPEKDQPI